MGEEGLRCGGYRRNGIVIVIVFCLVISAYRLFGNKGDGVLDTNRSKLPPLLGPGCTSVHCAVWTWSTA